MNNNEKHFMFPLYSFTHSIHFHKKGNEFCDALDDT